MPSERGRVPSETFARPDISHKSKKNIYIAPSVVFKKEKEWYERKSLHRDAKKMQEWNMQILYIFLVLPALKYLTN